MYVGIVAFGGFYCILFEASNVTSLRHPRLRICECIQSNMERQPAVPSRERPTTVVKQALVPLRGHSVDISAGKRDLSLQHGPTFVAQLL